MDFALKEDLKIFSITDHDTFEGTAIAEELAPKYSFSYLTGIEISARMMGKKIEILGYNFNSKSADLRKELLKIQTARRDRLDKTLEKLNTLGMKINLGEILEEVGESDSIGRPHFARVMVKKGLVTTVKEAFDKYLAKGKPAYVERVSVEPKNAINWI